MATQIRRCATLSILVLVGGFTAYGADEGSTALTNPLPVHNLYAPFTRVYEPLPSSALQPYRRTARIDLLQNYTSDFELRRLPAGEALVVDMELYTLEAVISRALVEQTELSVVLPVHYAWRGALDGILREYHSALGLPNSDRDRRPDDAFAYAYTTPAETFWRGAPGWELGNLALRLRHGLHTWRASALALLAAVQLPTASTGRGWGSGEPDLSLGAVYSQTGQRWFGHLEANFVQPLAEDQGSLRYHGFLHGSATLGYRFSQRWSLLTQLQGGASPYDTGLPELDKNPWLFSVGARYAAGDSWNLSATFLEGLTQETTPDFTVNVGIHLRF